MTDSSLFKYYLNINGLNQTKLAKMLNIKPQTLNNKILNKSEFSLQEILNICKILNISLEIKEAIFFNKNVVNTDNITSKIDNITYSNRN